MTSDDASASLAGTVRDALSPFLIVDGLVRDGLVEYVLTGKDPDLIDRLRLRLTPESSRDIDRLLGRPYLGLSHLNVGFDPHRSFLELRPGWSEREITRLYLQVYRAASPVQIFRLGRVLALVSPIAPSVWSGPDWLAILVNHVHNFVHRRYASLDGAHAAFVERWTPAFVAEVAEASGLPHDHAVRTALTALLTGSEGLRGHVRAAPAIALYATGAGDLFLRDHAEAVAAVVADLSVDMKREFLGNYVHRNPSAHGELVTALAVGASAPVRRSAVKVLALLDDEHLVRLAAPHLTTAPVGRLDDLVTHLLDRAGGPAAIEEALAGLPAGPRGAARAQLLRRAADQTRLPDAADQLVIPPYESPAEVELGEEFVTGVLDMVRKDHGFRNYRHLYEDEPSEDFLRLLAAALSGAVPLVQADAARWASNRRINDLTCTCAGRWLADHPEGTVLHEIRLSLVNTWSPSRIDWREGHGLFTEQLPDIRIAHDEMVAAGYPEPARAIVQGLVRLPEHDHDPDKAWPLVAEHLEVADHFLQPTDDHVSPALRMLEILARFPVVPSAVLPRLTFLAHSGTVQLRTEARRVLAGHPQVRSLAEQGLSDGKAARRESAVHWLGELGGDAVVPTLRSHLAKESDVTVRAAVLSVLERLGAEISDLISPDVLLAEARAGLSKKIPAALDPIPLDLLPTLRWASGDEVEPEIVHWWVVLAVKLKEPAGTGMFARYLGLLDEESQHLIGTWNLSAWIAHDTRRPPHQESHEFAVRHSAGRPGDDRYDRYFAAHQETLPASAASARGMLALTVAMRGDELTAATRAYLGNRRMRQRRPQAEYLIKALAAHGGDAPVQELLAVSRRFRQATVQETAARLAQDIATRRGWSADELADRTVQTAGFDDDGILRLSLGHQEYTARLTATMTLELRNPKGAVVKSLPAAPAAADEEVRAPYQEARAQLKASRAELADVVKTQTARLRDAMLYERTWTASQWRDHVLGHPLLSRLAERVIWVTGLGTPSQRTFRPLDDRTLLSAHEDPVVLADDDVVQVAHAVSVARGHTAADDGAGETPQAAELDAWHTHLADHDVTPLFDQFTGVLPQVDDGASHVDERSEYWLGGDVISQRARKLGYRREAILDAGGYTMFHKSHAPLGIGVIIEFTGTYINDEAETDAALTSLSFHGRRRGIPIAEVPPVVLAETYREYLEISAGGEYRPAARVR